MLKIRFFPSEILNYFVYYGKLVLGFSVVLNVGEKNMPIGLDRCLYKVVMTVGVLLASPLAYGQGGAGSSSSAVEAPAVEAPAVEAPAVEAPAVEAPAVEAPRVEVPAANPSARASEKAAQVQPTPSPKKPSLKPGKTIGKPKKSKEAWMDLQKKVETHKERKKQCKTHEGRFISFYDQIFKVENCMRRRVEISEGIFQIQARGLEIHPVEAKTIASIPEGSPISLASRDKGSRSCKELEKKYVTYTFVNVYFVENCRKRLFPDWDTYLNHRSKKGNSIGEIITLSYSEFYGLNDGSVLSQVQIKSLLP